ncbi:MAG: tetratricopeptide repeat protein [Bacteroidota bacterium]
MLKHVLLLGAWIGLMSQLSFAQADLEQARQLFQYEQLAEAEQELKTLLQNQPKNTDEVCFWLGKIQYQREDYAGAKAYFDQALMFKSKSPWGGIGKAMIAFKEQRIEEGREWVDKALGQWNKKRNPEVEFAAAEVLLGGGKEEIGDARQMLYDLKDRMQEDPRSYLLLGSYYHVSKVISLGIGELERAVQLAPDYIPAYVYLAELYVEQGKETGEATSFNLGFERAQEAIRINPEYGPAYRIRGELYLLLGEYDLAKEDLKTYVSLVKADRKARIRYASFLFLAKEYQEALDELNAIDTTTVVMRRLKAMSLNQLGRHEEAEAAMKAYFDLIPKEAFIIADDYHTMGEILRALGRLEEADANYLKMIEKDPNRSDIFEELAEAYRQEALVPEKLALAKRKARAELLKETERIQKMAERLQKEAANTRDSEVKAAKEASSAEQLAVVKAKEAEVEQLTQEAKEGKAESKPLYALEAHYREQARTHAKTLTLAHHYRLALALYKSDQYQQADLAFQKVHELKADYANPYTYRIQIAQRLEEADPDTYDWLLKAPCEDIISVWGESDPNSLDTKVMENLLLSYEVLARYHFNPTLSDTDFHCEEAKPYLQKIEAIDPNHELLSLLGDVCQ